MNGCVTVLLVDDHPIVREGYRRLLQDSGRINVVGEASTVEEACQKFDALDPNVVVMDIALPGVSGIEGIRRLLSRRADARVLVFSMYEDAIFVRRALDAGAAGYMTKASAPQVLVDAVDAVAGGRRYPQPRRGANARAATDERRSAPSTISRCESSKCSNSSCKAVR